MNFSKRNQPTHRIPSIAGSNKKKKKRKIQRNAVDEWNFATSIKGDEIPFYILK